MSRVLEENKSFHSAIPLATKHTLLIAIVSAKQRSFGNHVAKVLDFSPRNVYAASLRCLRIEQTINKEEEI